MQKKVIALSVAAAVAAPGAVSAAPTMYGQMHSSFDWIDDDNNGDSDDFVTAPSRNSRFGLKGSENLGVTLGRTSRENDNTPACKGALHNVADAIRESFKNHTLLFVDLLRLGLGDVRCRGLHLDDMCTKLCCHVGSVGHHIYRRLVFFAEAFAAGIRPDDGG